MKCRKIVLNTAPLILPPTLLSSANKDSVKEDMESWRRDSRQVTHHMNPHSVNQAFYLPFKGPSRNGNTTLILHWQTRQRETFQYSIQRRGKELHSFQLVSEQGECYCRHYLYLDASECTSHPVGVRLSCKRKIGESTFVTLELDG